MSTPQETDQTVLNDLSVEAMDSEQRNIVDQWQDELDAHHSQLPAHAAHVGDTVAGHEFVMTPSGTVEDAEQVKQLREAGQDTDVHTTSGRQS